MCVGICVMATFRMGSACVRSLGFYDNVYRFYVIIGTDCTFVANDVSSLNINITGLAFNFEYGSRILIVSLLLLKFIAIYYLTLYCQISLIIRQHFIDIRAEWLKFNRYLSKLSRMNCEFLLNRLNPLYIAYIYATTCE